MKPVFEYTDFRACLTDWLAARRLAGLPVSNRWFAMKMGVNSTSWLTSLVKGKKNLSKDTANKLSALMGHSPIEARYFETLVFFNQARTFSERNRYFAELSTLHKSTSATLVTSDQYDLYTCWYHSAVRSIIGMHGFNGNFSQLAATITPPISPSQAKKSVALLLRLGFIVKKDSDKYELTSPAITTGAEVRSLAVANFQRETMRLAQEALDRHSSNDRDIRTITVGISEKTYHEITAILTETKNRIIELANADAKADRVYQINMQAFPLSKPPTPEVRS